MWSGDTSAGATPSSGSAQPLFRYVAHVAAVFQCTGKRAGIRDGALWVTENKTGARLGIEITGELAEVIERINKRPRKAISPFLIQDDNGQPLSALALRSRFDKARNLAGVNFQFRDIRAKAATDTGDLAHSQKLLAHKNRDMTEHYVRARMGERVRPLR